MDNNGSLARYLGNDGDNDNDTANGSLSKYVVDDADTAEHPEGLARYLS